MGHATFVEIVRRATGHDPYPYQRRLADDGLPDLLRAPTGAGKTLAATLPWVYRRRFAADPDVRRQTPRWLVLVLPQRSLVDQTVGVVRGWLDRLDLAEEVPVHVLMGGVSTSDRTWKMHPGREAIFVGTQDMVLSRLLLRGYAESHDAWPVSFGLLNAGAQFVFDETQLMGPGLPTSLQLQGLREAFGTAAPVRSMWMSATVDPAALRSPDYPGPDVVVDLGSNDWAGPLRRRLEATRLVRQGDVARDPRSYATDVARLVLAYHAAGTRSIVVINTVDRAAAVYDALVKTHPDAAVVLLHSRFRPAERAVAVDRALADPGLAGTIVVATQVLEAGVDISSRLLVTEVAPWSSIVQRAGRCNRAGEHEEAMLLWLPVPATRGSAAPYEETDLAASTEALTALAGTEVTSSDLQDRPVQEVRQIYPVLRRRDLIGLFDTAPDISGNDIDVSQWIRDEDTIAAAVAWRRVDVGGPDEDDPFPLREELCPAPLGDLRDWFKRVGRAWLYDQGTGTWRRAGQEDVRPGAVLVLDADGGGYLDDRGWSPRSVVPVVPVPLTAAEVVEDVASDPRSVQSGRWVSLAEHLDDVCREVDLVLSEFGELPGLTVQQRTAAALAGLYHDLGKAHPVFADTLRRSSSEQQLPAGGPWAKSPAQKQARHSRRYFRHELVSALVLLDPACGVLDGTPEPDLVAYLVAAHHGKVRLTVRALPGEQDDGTVLGVRHDDVGILPVILPDGRQVSSLPPRLGLLALGADVHGDSWQARICRLRDRVDLGPFRLAFLEAVVRMADWRASARYDSVSEEVAS